jgi:hypothetical protein
MIRGLPEIPDHLTAPFACPNCRGQMKTVRNPSYGIGLARHHYLRVCNRCGHALFVPEELIASQREPAARQDAKSKAKPLEKIVPLAKLNPLARSRREKKKKKGGD